MIAALMRMRWAAKTAIKLAETRVDSLKDHKSAQSLEFSLQEFNELLALGYFEEDKIGVSFFLHWDSFTLSADKETSGMMMVKTPLVPLSLPGLLELLQRWGSA